MPADHLIARFRCDCEALTGGEPGGLGVAVSGGPDSLALLLLANSAFPGRVQAATVDHGLRPENAAEAAFVAGVCADRAIRHATLSDRDAQLAGASLQAQARGLRYRLLRAWAEAHGLPFLATGHHLDDQAETVLMRLARGAGLAGVAGVRARRRDGGVAILRPLLGWRRDELAAIVAEAGLVPVDDPSNRSEAFDRTRFRALLASVDLLPPSRLAAAAAHLADAEEALAWAAEREWTARVAPEEGGVAFDPSGLPTELLRRLASRAIDEVRGNGAWRRDGLADALARVAAGGCVTLAGVRIGGGTRWRFEPEPPRRGG